MLETPSFITWEPESSKLGGFRPLILPVQREAVLYLQALAKARLFNRHNQGSQNPR